MMIDDVVSILTHIFQIIKINMMSQYSHTDIIEYDPILIMTIQTDDDSISTY